MASSWTIIDHHIAIDTGDTIQHPDAREVYSLLSSGVIGNQEIDDKQIRGLRFSKIGSPFKCELNICNDSIVLDLYAVRKRKLHRIDLVAGQIIDHAVADNEWFYLTGDIDELQNLIRSSGIDSSGRISLSQYLDLIKYDCFSDKKIITNNVDNSFLRTFLSSECDVPVNLMANLYEYQKIGYSWMQKMITASQGCILADEMGLGKTLQIIAVFTEMKNRGEMPVLVVAPVSLLENWRRECEKFSPGLNVLIHHGSKRTGRAQELLKHDVIVISYNTAISDLSLLKMIEWNCVVLDEAQNIKNPDSERAKSVKAIRRESGIAVTGTPFENHISDIWSLVDFSVPGLLGTLSSFQNRISDDVLGAEAIEPIISPIMIRRLVAEVADDLPEKVIIPQQLELSEQEREGYEAIRQKINTKSSENKGNALAILQELRMFCTHQFLCQDDLCGDPPMYSIKYQRFCEIVREIIQKNEKIIVFTSYKKMFDVFRKDIPGRFDVSIDFINGDTPVDDRQEIVDWFNNYKGSAILFLNPRAAGTGLNITGANHVIHYNLEWNPSLEDQASARAFRRGQTKTVFIYRLFYKDTVEQVVNERIERKREIATTAVVGTDGTNNDRIDIVRALELAPRL